MPLMPQSTQLSVVLPFKVTASPPAHAARKRDKAAFLESLCKPIDILPEIEETLSCVGAAMVPSGSVNLMRPRVKQMASQAFAARWNHVVSL